MQPSEIYKMTAFELSFWSNNAVTILKRGRRRLG